MAKLHHLTLKAAVAKYQPLHIEGKTEEEIRAAISADEKSFDSEGVEEIYQAIIAPAENKSNSQSRAHIIISPFHDIQDFSKRYEAGTDVSHFDKARLEKLVSNNLVELK